MALYTSDVVSCDICHREEKVNSHLDFPRCGSVKTICSNRLLLPKLAPGKIYIVRNCDCGPNTWYRTINEDTKTFKCNCSNELRIENNPEPVVVSDMDDVAELRCNQIVYRAYLVVTEKETIEKLRADLKVKAEESEKLKENFEKLKSENEKMLEQIRNLKSHEQMATFLEKSLEDKKEENRFLRELIKSMSSFKKEEAIENTKMDN